MVLVFDPIPGEKWEIFWLSKEGCGIKFPLKLVDAIIVVSYLLNYLMCEHESIVLSAIIILLTIIVLLLLYLLTVEICLRELTKIIQVLLDKQFFDFT